MSWLRGLTIIGLGMLGCACSLQFTPRPHPFYHLVLKQYPDNLPTLYLQGREGFTSGQFRTAREAFSRFTQLAPSDPRGWVALGQCELELNNFSTAERAFRQALTLREDAAAASGLATAVLMQGRVDEAGKLLATARTRYGVSGPLLQAEGDAALIEGRLEDALKAYEECLARNPNQAELRDRVRDLREFLTNRP
jgi:Flp pilus assembly protein TadD